jgi:hypothetical protein
MLPLDELAVAALLEKHGVYASRQVAANDRLDIAWQVLRLTGGHALHVGYAAFQLAAAVREGNDLVEAVASIPSSNGDIDQYYRTLFAPPTATLARESLSIMASCPFDLSVAEVADLMQPKADVRAVEDALRPYFHLFQRIGGQYYFFHDSLRVFANLHVNGPRLPTQSQIAFLVHLQQDPRAGDHLLHLAAEGGDELIATDGIDCDWLSRQVAAGASISLLNEGLKLMALAALKRHDWAKMVHWWCLQACLQRAEFEGTFTEATLIDAWLSVKRLSLVERYLFVSGHFLSRVYPGPDILDLVEEHGESELAERLRSRQLGQPTPEIGELHLMDDFGHFVRHASRRLPANELLPLIRARVEKASEGRDVNNMPMIRDPERMIARLVDTIIRECLAANDLDRVEEWLNVGPGEVSEPLRAEHFLRVRLLRRDLAANSARVKAAIEVVESLQVLEDLARGGGFDSEVRTAVTSFYLNALLRNQVHWLDRGQIASVTQDLLCDVTISSRLALQDRLNQIYDATASINCKAGKVFSLAIVRLVETVTLRPSEWRRGIEEFARAIRQLAGYRFSSDDIHAAQGFVGCLGTIIRAAAQCAKRFSAESEFAEVVESQLIPALVEGRVNYEAGHLSIIDMLQAEAICSDLSLRLLRTVEGWFTESVEFKAVPLIDLARRFARAGNSIGADRVLLSGVRAAFTYGYRKDTTLNDFLDAFNAVAPHLGTEQFRRTADFTANAILILDDLTDGRMLYYASSYFIAMTCRYDMTLAARIAQRLWTRCRQLRPTWILQAAEEHEVETTEIMTTFARIAPDVILTGSEDDSEQSDHYAPRHEFVTSGTVFPASLNELVTALESSLERSAYGSGFGGVAGLVKAFVSRGDTSLALAIFADFESALRQMVQAYPMPTIE